jgi:hypothetical protein
MRISFSAFTTVLLLAFTAYAGSPPITGAYAKQLSQSDAVQIKAAVFKERSISHNIKKIEAARPDKVTVQTTTRTAVDEDTYYEFNAYKRAGAWTIDANSIQISIEKRDFRTNGPAVIR